MICGASLYINYSPIFFVRTDNTHSQSTMASHITKPQITPDKPSIFPA